MKHTAKAYANIALVKYWGKRDTQLNLPAGGSISITLNHLYTTTSLQFLDHLERDSLLLNGEPAAEPQLQRVSGFLDLFRRQSGVLKYAEIVSENNFPTGAGLASSASAFAALALAADHALSLNSSASRLSELARQGSGSAARSIFGGFVEMEPGKSEKGADAVAVPLFSEEHWPLEVLIFITEESAKPVGSTEGMNRTAYSSPYYAAWLATNQQDLDGVRQAIEKKNFEQLGEITEHNCLKMHALAMSANPGLIYWNSSTLALMHRVREIRQKGLPAYFTIDAGPQVKVLCPPGYATRIKDAIGDIPGTSARTPDIKQILVTGLGPGAQILS